VAFTDALQLVRQRGPVRVTGRWPELWAAIGVDPPEAKTARSALAKLAEHRIVIRVSGHQWRLNTTEIESRRPERGAPRVAPTTEHPTQKRTSSSSPNRLRSRQGATRDSGPSLSRVRARVTKLDHRPRRRGPLWLSDPHPLVSRLVAGIEQGSALGVGEAAVVTLTVAPGVDLDAVGLAFGERLDGLFEGAWLVPETSPKGRRHYHGLVIAPSRGELIGAWQRSGGGIARAQCLDPLDRLDHEHLHKAVAYAMKRRHMEPGEVIATGVLASPWARTSQPTSGPLGPLAPLVPLTEARDS